MAMPFVNYFFIPLFVMVSIYFSIKHLAKGLDKLSLNLLTRVFYPFLTLLLVFILAFLFSDLHNVMIFKDIMQAIIFVVIIVLYSMEIKNINDYETFNRHFVYQVVAAAGLISVLGLIKMLFTLSGTTINFSKEIPLYTSSLNTDHNFFCLLVILGVLSIIYLFYNQKVSKLNSILLQLLLFLMSVSILFSTSRRGFVLFIILLILIIALSISNLWSTLFKRINLKLFGGLFLSFLLLIVLYFSTYNSKLFFGIKRSEFNLNLINKTLPELSYRYGSVFGMNIKSVEMIFPIEFDSRYPYTRWGKRIHEEVFPLTGENVGIIPEGTVGYKIDKRSDADTWNGNAYSYTSIERLYKGDTAGMTTASFRASVYCFVSNDFNGSWVAIAAEGNSVGEKKKNYDPGLRNQWQKLDINFSSRRGIPPAYLYVVKEGTTDFESLNGYVIFAYPEYRKISDTILYSTITTERKNGSYYSSFIGTEIIQTFFKRTKLLFSQQTVQDTLNATAFGIIPSGELSYSRVERWQYGYYIFKDKYTLKQKLWGDGFGYLSQFGSKFGKSKLDYPHNPLISAFLYSGIIGGLIYLWFIGLVFYYYLKYRKYHMFFFVCFPVVFFFSFLSADNHFSIPIFTFFCIIPFFTRYLIKRGILLDSSANSDLKC